MDNPEDDDWKVVLDHPPRSRRHAQEDDDDHRPEDANHAFDAPGLSTPLTTEYRNVGIPEPRDASSSHSTHSFREHEATTSGQNVTEAEVEAVDHMRAADNEQAAWLDEDYHDEEDDPPIDA